MLGAIRGMAGGKAEAAGAARIGMNGLLEVRLAGLLQLGLCVTFSRHTSPVRELRLNLTSTPDLSRCPSIRCSPQAFSLPPNPSKPAIKKRMGSNPALWRGARPLAGDLLDYAVGDVFQLLQLADELRFQLGDAGEEVVERLSQAHAGGTAAGQVGGREWVKERPDFPCSLPQQRVVQAATTAYARCAPRFSCLSACLLPSRRMELCRG